MESKLSPLLVLLFLSWFQCYNCHITLTYPPSRKYTLDFFNSIFSPAPCGMPKGFGPITDLRAGSTFNITWRLGAPDHNGGYMLQILSPNGTIVTNLTRNGTNYIGSFDDAERYTEQYEVHLPNKECLNCSIRLLRQDLQKRFYFWTCADVNIKTKGFPETCSSHGRFENGKCQCDSLYSGSVCQYKDECWSVADCNNNGQCIDRKSRAHPKKVCYCNKGWYGFSCEKVSPMKDIPNDFVGYNHFQIRLGVIDIFWKMLKDQGEIEVIMKMMTKSWLAVGWRDLDTNVSCMAFPSFPPSNERRTNEFGGTQATLRKRRNPHPMACNDVVVGYVQGELSYIHDYYLRQQHTPVADALLGGKDDLTGAVGLEKSGFTFMGFRKKLKASERSDNSIVDRVMHVIWSRGQEAEKMTLRPEDANYKLMMLYQPYYKNGYDDCMYHLQDRMFRGQIQLNFFKALPFKKMDLTNGTVGLIQSDTLLPWELSIGLTLGAFSLLVVVSILLLCCKVDLERNNKRMEEARKKNALPLHGEVNVVALEEFENIKKEPLETTELTTDEVGPPENPEPSVVVTSVDEISVAIDTNVATSPIYDNVSIDSVHEPEEIAGLAAEENDYEVALAVVAVSVSDIVDLEESEDTETNQVEVADVVADEVADEVADVVADVVSDSSDTSGADDKTTTDDESTSDKSESDDESKELKAKEAVDSSEAATGDQVEGAMLQEVQGQEEQDAVAMLDESFVDEEETTQF